MGDTIRKGLFSRQKNFFPNGTACAYIVWYERKSFQQRKRVSDVQEYPNNQRNE